jgi:hypothetical protein
MSLQDATPTPLRRTSPRKSAAATGSAASSTTLTPLPAQLLDYGDLQDDDEDDEEVAGANEASGATGVAPAEAAVATQPSDGRIVAAAKIFCDVDNCPGRGFNPGVLCVLCEADLHMECFLGTVRKMKEYPEGCHDEIFCSDVCCLWHGNSRIDVSVVRKERTDLQSLLKKQLVELARTAQVRVTQRVNKKSLQVSKAMMVRRLMAKKFNALIGVDAAAPVPTPKPQKTIHVRFRLINCLFSEELASSTGDADVVDRAALDTGAVGDNSAFWKLCEERFNKGFPVDSIDGALFADKLHFNHPIIDAHHEPIRPSQRGVFSSSDLHSLWKEIQKEYEKVMQNFKKSGNHNSSFTKEAMKVYRMEEANDEESVQSSVNSADLDDVFGVENGGFCNFTNSVVIVYLRLWLNERPGLTGFVSRQLPDVMQVDTMQAPAAISAVKQQSAAEASRLRKSPDIIADSINNLAKARKMDDGKKEMHRSITEFHQSETVKSKITAKVEEINLVRMQIEVMTQRYDGCSDPDRKEKYKKALDDLENKLDTLLMP